MDGGDCAQDAHAWAAVQFGGVDLKDPRRNRRLVDLAGALGEHPGMSLPQLLPDWSDLQGAYRFLSNDAIDYRAILAPHLAWTRNAVAAAPVVLCVQDDTTLDYTCRTGLTGLGVIGDGNGRGLLQHGALAVLPGHGPHAPQVAGLLDLAYHAPVPAPEKETRRQRQARWTLPDVWPEAAAALGPWPGAGRLIHVGDRHADLFRFFHVCRNLGHGFVVRAMHDRWIDEDTRHLWEKLEAQRPVGTQTVTIGAQRDKGNQVKRSGREATVTIRLAPVGVPPSRNDPRTQGALPLALGAIHVREEHPPEGIKPAEVVAWMLLTSEPVACLEQAQVILGYYACRWSIEEFHRCLKEGCRIESSQLDAAADIMRLGAILAPLAVRLLRLRDACDPAGQDPSANTPATLAHLVPPLYIRLAAALGQTDPATLTPRQFLLIVAQRGGYLGRKHDPRPGWKVLWRGWTDLVQMVQGAELLEQLQSQGKSCV